MNPHHITHPRHIGDGNKMVLDTLSDAYQVALQLASEGHHIQAVCAGQCQPIIWIRDSRLTLNFDSYSAKYGRDSAGRYQIRSTQRDGVAIHWIIRHHKTRRAA